MQADRRPGPGRDRGPGPEAPAADQGGGADPAGEGRNLGLHLAGGVRTHGAGRQ